MSDCTSGNCPVDSVGKGAWRTGVISTSVAVRVDEGLRYLIVSCHGVSLVGEERGNRIEEYRGGNWQLSIASERDDCVSQLLCSLSGFDH